MKLTRNLAYWLLLAGAGLWLALAFLAPYASSQSWGLGPFLYAFFAPVCHQIPERSFHCCGQPLAVCHRCLGLYGGFVLGLLLLPMLHRLRERLLETPRVMLLFFAPMLLDVTVWENSYPTRTLTGLVAAFPVGLFVWAAAHQILHRTSTNQGENHEPRTAR